MIFKRIPPEDTLSHVVKEYWIYENADPAPVRQKIIPDGYCEIVIHYGDPYRICLYGDWEEQSKLLLAGQIHKAFYLENTGRSGMIGIKLHPVAPCMLFGLAMSEITDRVIPLEETGCDVEPLLQLTSGEREVQSTIAAANAWLSALAPVSEPEPVMQVREAVDHILQHNGLIGIEALARDAGVTRRHLERNFKKIVGLTPKFYARIIQFGYIFKAIEAGETAWVDVALNSGYFDQSHFIKNFSAFTGELPSKYAFEEDNLANFFLRR